MKIALATPPMPSSIPDGLCWTEKLVKQAAAQNASIICFPESYIPGYPLEEYGVEQRSPEKLQSALENVCNVAAENNIAVIMPMDWYRADGLLNLAFVISAECKILGYQTKNQLDPTEDLIWKAGTDRSLFEIDGVKVGITICHEGFRYPESVRWAARQGAAIVFHPNCTGSNRRGRKLREWGSKENLYYEKATMLRAMENTIYFASVNYCFEYPDSATALVAPDGTCVAYQPYGVPGVVVGEVDPTSATGLLARRFNASQYQPV